MHEVTHEEDTAVTDVEKPVAVGPQRDCLIVIYDREKALQGKRVELRGGVVRLGRNPDNELVWATKVCRAGTPASNGATTIGWSWTWGRATALSTTASR